MNAVATASATLRGRMFAALLTEPARFVVAMVPSPQPPAAMSGSKSRNDSEPFDRLRPHARLALRRVRQRHLVVALPGGRRANHEIAFAAERDADAVTP